MDNYLKTIETATEFINEILEQVVSSHDAARAVNIDIAIKYGYECVSLGLFVLRQSFNCSYNVLVYRRFQDII